MLHLRGVLQLPRTGGCFPQALGLKMECLAPDSYCKDIHLHYLGRLLCKTLLGPALLFLNMLPTVHDRGLVCPGTYLRESTSTAEHPNPVNVSTLNYFE